MARRQRCPRRHDPPNSATTPTAHPNQHHHQRPHNDKTSLNPRSSCRLQPSFVSPAAAAPPLVLAAAAVALSAVTLRALQLQTRFPRLRRAATRLQLHMLRVARPRLRALQPFLSALPPRPRLILRAPPSSPPSGSSDADVNAAATAPTAATAAAAAATAAVSAAASAAKKNDIAVVVGEDGEQMSANDALDRVSNRTKAALEAAAARSLSPAEYQRLPPAQRRARLAHALAAAADSPAAAAPTSGSGPQVAAEWSTGPSATATANSASGVFEGTGLFGLGGAWRGRLDGSDSGSSTSGSSSSDSFNPSTGNGGRFDAARAAAGSQMRAAARRQASRSRSRSRSSTRRGRRRGVSGAQAFLRLAESVNGRAAALGFTLCLAREVLEPGHPSLFEQVVDVVVPIAAGTPPFLVAVCDRLADLLT